VRPWACRGCAGFTGNLSLQCRPRIRTMNCSSRRKSALISLGSRSPSGRAPAPARFIETCLFVPDLLTGDEPENGEWFETNGAIFKLMRRGNGQSSSSANRVRSPVGRRCAPPVGSRSGSGPCPGSWEAATSQIDRPWRPYTAVGAPASCSAAIQFVESPRWAPFAYPPRRFLDPPAEGRTAQSRSTAPGWETSVASHQRPASNAAPARGFGSACGN
jgi:hypothetical protein